MGFNLTKGVFMQIDLSRTVELLEKEYNLDYEQKNKDWEYIKYLIKTEMEDDGSEEAWSS